MTGAALVLHFNPALFGGEFLLLPETKSIAAFLKKKDGIQMNKNLEKEITSGVSAIKSSSGFERFQLLLNCLHTVCQPGASTILTQDFESSASNINPAIEKIIEFSFKRYLTPISLQQVADVAAMSIPTFCRFFKKNIKKSYFDFLQDLRVSHACKLLTNTDKPVMEICYESGYNSWAHFSKQFKHVKEMTPSEYRRLMSET